MSDRILETIADTMALHQPTTRRVQSPVRPDVYLNKPACKGCDWVGEGFKDEAHRTHSAEAIVAALKRHRIQLTQLPEPYITEWPIGLAADGYGLTVHGGRVWDGDDGCEGHEPVGAREIGALWLAAAEAAEAKDG